MPSECTNENPSVASLLEDAKRQLAESEERHANAIKSREFLVNEVLEHLSQISPESCSKVYNHFKDKCKLTMDSKFIGTFNVNFSQQLMLKDIKIGERTILSSDNNSIISEFEISGKTDSHSYSALVEEHKDIKSSVIKKVRNLSFTPSNAELKSMGKAIEENPLLVSHLSSLVMDYETLCTDRDGIRQKYSNMAHINIEFVAEDLTIMVQVAHAAFVQFGWKITFDAYPMQWIHKIKVKLDEESTPLLSQHRYKDYLYGTEDIGKSEILNDILEALPSY